MVRALGLPVFSHSASTSSSARASMASAMRKQGQAALRRGGVGANPRRRSMPPRRRGRRRQGPNRAWWRRPLRSMGSRDPWWPRPGCRCTPRRRSSSAHAGHLSSMLLLPVVGLARSCHGPQSHSRRPPDKRHPPRSHCLPCPLSGSRYAGTVRATGGGRRCACCWWGPVEWGRRSPGSPPGGRCSSTSSWPTTPSTGPSAPRRPPASDSRPSHSTPPTRRPSRSCCAPNAATSSSMPWTRASSCPCSTRRCTPESHYLDMAMSLVAPPSRASLHRDRSQAR